MAHTSLIPETQILKPLDPSLSNENDWPDFVLTAAEVSDPHSGEFETLLRARVGSPLTLVGKLSKSRDQLQYLIQDKSGQILHTLPALISVSNVERFCYGQDDNGKAVLWAAGKAGWFRIQPSRAYRAIHRRSCEAVTVLYFLADLYTELKGRKQKSTTVETVFKQYAQDDSSNCDDELEAEQVFLRHRSFLLDCMKDGKEDINWKNTSIHDFLIQSSDDETSSSAPDAESTAQTPQARDSSDEEPSRRLSGKSKSSLRPRSGKYSLKAIGRRRDIDGVGPPQIALDAIQSPLKRKITAGHNFRPRKRAATSDEQPDAIMHSASESESSEDLTSETQLPLDTKKQNPTPGQAPRIKIIEESLPSYQPQGPGDTWICSFDGCSYVVYGASKPDNQELIREHYKQHAMESQAQIDLIYQEERSWLPVGNLIKRIRELAAQDKVPDTAEQTSAVEPGGAADAERPKMIRRKSP